MAMKHLMILGSKMKNIIISFFLALFISGVCSAEGINGYRGAKWGMSKKEVKKIIEKETLHMVREHSDGYHIQDSILENEVDILYYFSPLSDQLCIVVMVFHSTLLYDDIRAMLKEKYGNPFFSNDSYLRKDFWAWPSTKTPKTSIALQGKFNEINVVYSNAEISKKMQEEQKKLLLKSKDKDKF